MSQQSKVQIKEWVECEIWERGTLSEFRLCEGNTVSDVAKNELAKILADLSSNTIDRMWVIVDGATYEKTSQNSRPSSPGNILEVTTSDAWTYTGNYTAVLTGNSSRGSSDYYNSIALSLNLTSGSELILTVKWQFSGAASGMHGNEICASRLGGIGDDYDYPISSVSIYYGGVEQERKTASCSVTNNTLKVTHADPFSGPQDIDEVLYLTSSPYNGAYPNYFDKFDGFTISVEADQDVYFDAEFVFG